MNLKSLMSLSKKYKKEENNNSSAFELTEEKIQEQMSHIRELISFFRWYPDLFIDYIKGKDSTFKFYFYQRTFLRAVMRHKYVYAVFPRACVNAPIAKAWTNLSN